jgi:hypothetical protein
MPTSKTYQKPTSISEAYSNPRYQGKIVIESPEGIYSTANGDQAVKKLKTLRKKYDAEQVVSTVIPKGFVVSGSLVTVAA